MVTKEQDFQYDFVKVLSNSSQDMWKDFVHPVVHHSSNPEGVLHDLTWKHSIKP